jgi:predicted MPP superfamily phosphohydrolase
LRDVDVDLTRRDLVRLGLAGSAATLGAGWLGWWGAHRTPAVRRFVVELERLPRGFQGFRILLLADLHAGPFMDRASVSEALRIVDSVEKDLVVLAGDLVDAWASPRDLHDLTAELGELRAGHGVLAVPGNHEHFAGIARSTRALKDAGLTVLAGGHTVLERDGDALAVLGVDDPGGRVFDPPQDEAVMAARREAPEDLIPILIAHRPRAFDAAARVGIPLTLSGHTHGGQVGLPWRDLTPVRLRTPYVRGRYRRGGAHLVVTRGVGTSGLPIRFGVPPSVALVTLRRA